MLFHPASNILTGFCGYRSKLWLFTEDWEFLVGFSDYQILKNHFPPWLWLFVQVLLQRRTTSIEMENFITYPSKGRTITVLATGHKKCNTSFMLTVKLNKRQTGTYRIQCNAAPLITGLTGSNFAWSTDVQHCVSLEEWKTNLMSLAILFHFLCAQHVSDINPYPANVENTVSS